MNLSRRMRTISTPLAGTGLLLTVIGCSSAPPQLGPVPEIRTPPQVGPVPEIREYSDREIPSNQDLTMTVSFPHEAPDPEELAQGVTTRPNYLVPVDARVVISVPVQEQMREERQQARGLKGGGDNEGITNFKTTGHFNMAEQQIVRSLLGKGFIVVDRSKFEAKLRDQRVETRSNHYSEAMKAEVEAVNSKMEAGIITLDQRASVLAEIEKKYEDRQKNGGRKPGDAKELVDDSELIRAAQAGTVRADFILQVNTFTTDSISDKVEYLIDHEQVSSVCNDNPGLRSELDRRGGSSIVRPGFFGYLNAELIDVQTGAIVWVGAHRVETLNVLGEGFQVTVPVTKRVNNGIDANRDISNYNRDLRELHADAVKLKQAIEGGISNYNRDLRGLHADAVNLKQAIEGGSFKSPLLEQRIGQFNQLTARVNSFESPLLEQRIGEFNQLTERVNQLNSGEGPDGLRTSFAFEYVVEPVELRPHLPTAWDLAMVQERYNAASSPEVAADLRQKIRRHDEFLTGHYAELAKLVAKELISTIPSQ